VIPFFDASVLIYLIEGNEPFAGRAREQLATLTQAHPTSARQSSIYRGLNVASGR